MKSNNLYNRIYDHSFSLLLTFSFYVLIFAVLLSCEDEAAVSDLQESESNAVTDHTGATYTIDHGQATDNNQDSFVEKKDSRGVTLWKITHAASSEDEQARLVTLDDEENPWVVFSVDGGRYEEDFVTKKFIANDIFDPVSYGQGGRAKVAVIAQLDPEDGKIVKRSFLNAHSNNGNTHSFSIKKMGVKPSEVLLESETGTWPPAVAGRTHQKMLGITDENRIDNAFHLQSGMSSPLSKIFRSEQKK